MEKFTKGPWSWNGYSLVLVEDTPLCALVNSSVNTGDPTEDYANAALIAAAPEMYALLKKLQIEGGLGVARHREIDRLLTKARGE